MVIVVARIDAELHMDSVVIVFVTIDNDSETVSVDIIGAETLADAEGPGAPEIVKVVVDVDVTVDVSVDIEGFGQEPDAELPGSVNVVVEAEHDADAELPGRVIVVVDVNVDVSVDATLAEHEADA
jgi:hypothetical protein